jgi:hypothetical protein
MGHKKIHYELVDCVHQVRNAVDCKNNNRPPCSIRHQEFLGQLNDKILLLHRVIYLFSTCFTLRYFYISIM